MWNLEAALEDGDRLKLREALRGIVGKIVIHSKEHKTQTGKVRRKPGEIEVTLLRGTGLEMLADVATSPQRCEQVLRISASDLA
jgi:hypothetical protein